MSLFSMFFFISLYMQQVLGYDALKAGVAYLPLAGRIIVSAGLASQLVTRFGFKPVLVGGLRAHRGRAAVVLPGLASDGTLRGATSCSRRCSPRVGLGFAFVSMTDRRGRRRRAARGRARLRADQHVAAGRRRARAGDPRRGRDEQDRQRHDRRRRRAVRAAGALTEGFQAAFTVGTGFAVLGAILAAVLISSRDSREHAAAARAGELEPAPAAA